MSCVSVFLEGAKRHNFVAFLCPQLLPFISKSLNCGDVRVVGEHKNTVGEHKNKAFNLYGGLLSADITLLCHDQNIMSWFGRSS